MPTRPGVARFPETRRGRAAGVGGAISPPGGGVAPYLLVVLLPLEAGDVVLAHRLRVLAVLWLLSGIVG